MNDQTNNTPRYAIGIDLGTTHSALSYVNLVESDGEKSSHGVLKVPQLSAPGRSKSCRCCPPSSTCPTPMK